MLETPLGKIKILKNNKEIDYVAEIYNADVPPAKNKPLAGCYRINVDFEENDTISCELISSLEIEKGNSGGENYSCKVFESIPYVFLSFTIILSKSLSTISIIVLLTNAWLSYNSFGDLLFVRISCISFQSPRQKSFGLC